MDAGAANDPRTKASQGRKQPLLSEKEMVILSTKQEARKHSIYGDFASGIIGFLIVASSIE